MKKIIHITNLSLRFSILAFAFFGCVKKDDFYKKSEGESGRQQVVQIAGSDELIQFARDVDPAIDTFALIDIRRYPSSEAGLNQPLTVKLMANPSLITSYNTANGTSYVQLPVSGYTLLEDLNNITFQPGEAVKEVKIRLDKGALDLSQQYALAFTLSEVGTGSAINTNFQNAIYSIGIKNQYDGDYHSTGVFHHPTAGDRDIDEDKHLSTAGPNSVVTGLGDLGSSGYEMILTVNADNTVTITPAGVTPNVDQHWGANFYDPATRTFHLHYSYNTAAPRIIEETLEHK